MKYLNILLITDSFPYASTEQFLETEIKYCENFNVTIMPQHDGKNCRLLNNENIRIDNFLIDNKKLTSQEKIFYTLKMLFNPYFIKECFYQNLFNITKLKSFRASMLNLYHYYKYFNQYFLQKNGLENLIVYTYWNNEVTYALQILKKKYGYKLISRIHGFDLYKERRVSKYMPLKSQFTKNIDKVYTITESANKYLNQEYGFLYNKVEVSRLGVEDKKIISKPNEEDVFHIVSCSFLTEVKQVHKIIEALVVLGKNNSNLEYLWTHIGDGYLYDNISDLAKTLLSEVDNVKYDLKGEMKNQDVYKFYKQNNVDVFLNVSKSEGVPVSIMEAMSCYIPIVAPDIGGISDMVETGVNGILLSNKPLVPEIVVALGQDKFFKNRNIRENSYKIFFSKYNAKINYSIFFNNLKNLLDKR